jgi:hypothetical protein
MPSMTLAPRILLALVATWLGGCVSLNEQPIADGPRLSAVPVRDGSGTRAVIGASRRWQVLLSGCDVAPDRAAAAPIQRLGCATLNNLAHMVADPADLGPGRPLGAADAVRESESIVRYRTGKVTPLNDNLAAP